MNSGPIDVPKYVAEKFNTPPRHPSGKPDAPIKSAERIFYLVAHTLQTVDSPEWEIDDRRYQSLNSNEPYGLEFVHGIFFVYGVQRGIKDALAIFKSGYLAADYFVWLVTKGKREIDWNLSLDMEP